MPTKYFIADEATVLDLNTRGIHPSAHTKRWVPVLRHADGVLFAARLSEGAQDGLARLVANGAVTAGEAAAIEAALVEELPAGWEDAEEV